MKTDLKKMRLIISPSGQEWQLFWRTIFNFILAFIFSIIVIGMSGADIPKISKVEKIHQHMKQESVKEIL